MKKLLAVLLCTALCLGSFFPPAFAEDSTAMLIARIHGTDSIIREVREQCEAEDRTPLKPPVTLRILWLGYTHVTYNSLDYRMEPQYMEYLYAVALNFEKALEKWANGSVDIECDVYLIDREVSLTRDEGADFLYLSQKTAGPDISRYAQWKPYDSVITTIMSGGEENEKRNRGKPEYGKIGPIMGICTSGILDPVRYSTFDLYLPFPGTYPVRDPYVPALDATGAAIHEWEHTFDCLGELTGVEFPVTHAYFGAPEFPGYRKYKAGDMDFTYLSLVFTANLPYSGKNGTKRVGMYPGMWKLLHRENLHFGIYTIRNAAGQYLSAQRSEPTLTVSDTPCPWYVSYAAENQVIISPTGIPEWRIDLDNAADAENNMVKLIGFCGDLKAQSWILTPESGGTCCIRTAYESHRALYVPGPGEKAVILSDSMAPSPDRIRWTFTRVD